MARCTKRRVRNGKLVQILLTDTRPPLQQNWTVLHMESAMFTEQCVTCTRQTNHRDLALEEIYNYVNNDLSIAAEDVVWMAAQNPCSAPIFQTSYNVLMNASYKYKYKCSVFGFLLLTYFSGKVISGVHCEQIFEMSRPKLVSSAISHSPVHNMLKIFLPFTF